MFSILAIISFVTLLPNILVHAAPSFLHSVATRGSPTQINAFLSAHNVVRAAHNATALTWSKDYAEKAEAWADNCQLKRTDGSLSDTPYGEHHVAATGIFPISTAIGLFSQDVAQYNPEAPTYNHFTQVVWKSTTQVGCARARCDDIFDRALGKATYYVCFYDPVGNVVGEAQENVQV